MPEQFDINLLIKKSNHYGKPKNISYTYGTAGFRLNGELLSSVVFRMGILACIRSRYKKGKAIGIMITASHNPIKDNGVKIVDPMGEMLEPDWEIIATELANALDENVPAFVKDLLQKLQITLEGTSHVVIGRDTRPTGEGLAQAAIDGVACMNGRVSYFGLLTTPQAHYIVRSLNSKYGDPTENGYFEKFSKAYVKLVEPYYGDKEATPVILDAANGVGASKMKELAALIDPKYLKVQVVNDGSSGELNLNCGADHVKTTQSPPENVEANPNMRYASLDGDADRLICFYYDQANKFHLLDGDKIASFTAMFFGELVAKLKFDLTIGIVQTAYANGSSTKFLSEKLQLPVACTETGVKHLHHKAEEFDIGIYFEANGHGTVLFSSKVYKAIHLLEEAGVPKELSQALHNFKWSVELINQSVGDAISVFLFIEAALLIQNMTPLKWDNLYQDLPNRLAKGKVRNRALFKAVDADRVLQEPKGFQEKINKHVAKFKEGRAFVRPSGTEDVVRVYSEADTQANADALSNLILKDLEEYSK